MSVQAMTWVIEHSESTLASRLVLLAIANHAKSDGTDAWPSVATIAKEARISETQTHRCIRRLGKIGELAIDIGAGPKGTNLYRLPKMPQLGLNDTPAKLTPPAKQVQKELKGGAIRASQMAPEPSLTFLDSKENRPSADGAFDTFWNSYPRKVGKQKAQACWQKMSFSEQISALNGLKLWKQTDQWHRDNGMYIPHGSTFLVQRRWQDEPWTGAFKEQAVS